VTVWTAWEGVDLLGCAALKQIDGGHAEVKSMRTDPAQLRRGVAALLLGHLIGVARARGYRRLSLETGTGAAFEPAHRLYEHFGFAWCGPFADYPETDFSRFMTLKLNGEE